MTPSSSAGESSSMMPVVAQTVAFLGERPSANAFGIACWRRRPSASAGRPARTGARSSRAAAAPPAASRRGAPIAASASLSEANSCSAARPPTMTIIDERALQADERARPPSTTYTAPEQEHRQGHPELQSGVLAERGGSGHLMKDSGRRAARLINIYRRRESPAPCRKPCSRVGGASPSMLGPHAAAPHPARPGRGASASCSGPCCRSARPRRPPGRSRRRSIATTSLIGGHKAQASGC